MSINNVIVFGPTGAVGGIAARTAEQRGAKVFLAMRDPSKEISSLSPAEEKEGNYERVQADLTKPDTIHAAVTKSGAKHAFIYLCFGTPDHMKSAIEALKASGIEWIVFLSSISVNKKGPKHITPDDFIAFAHAQVEINLDEVFGPTKYVAVRPAFFATNVKQFWGKMIQNGEVKVISREVVGDYIASEDIGRVCGVLTAGGAQAAQGRTAIPLAGPRLVKVAEALATIGSVLGKEIKVTEVSEQAVLDHLTKEEGIPEPIAKQICKMFSESPPEEEDIYQPQVYKEAVENVSKFGGGGKPTSFEEWATKHKGITF